MENKYTKLSELVDSEFTIELVAGYVFKRWDSTNKKMETSDKWAEGFRKVYPVSTDKGQMDLGSGQLGSLLEAVFKDGKADLNGVTFHVKSNGKSGMDIRYFFSAVKTVDEGVDEQPEFSYD